MSIQDLKIYGSALITPPLIEDQRGFFSPLIGRKEFAQLGISFELSQINSSFSTHRYTLRGLHMQKPPASEIKVIRVLQGEIWDVIVDLRPNSPTYKLWVGTTLNASDRQILVIPAGCAHGFMTLEPNTEIIYLVDKQYRPGLELVIRWDDPNLNIKWPFAPAVMSEKDARALQYNWD